MIGKAGSGKTMLLAALVRGLIAAGVEPVSADYESRRRRARSAPLAVLAPTNKAASVLRGRGVPATTIHRILYTPLYHPDYEAIAEWLTGKADAAEGRGPERGGARPGDGLLPARIRRSRARWRAPGCAGSDFIKGWKRRDEPLDIGLVDEASMLDERQFDDLRALFRTLVLFGDPAQLAPVGGGGGDGVRRRCRTTAQLTLQPGAPAGGGQPDPRPRARARRPGARASATSRTWCAQAAARDDRVVIAPRVDAGAMARAPVLVWRNATRVRLIQAFRRAHGAPPDALLPGEPLICDGIELPLKHRRKRIDLEARGLIKGAQAIYLGPGRRPGFARLLRRRAPRSRRSGSRASSRSRRRARRSRSSSPRRAWARCSCTARR